ncbi:thioredoxin reductase 2 [Trichuris trichiura]|uniref:Thioredoxin reductase 2 n=1 Tax=Trichuris trichiura TaxID=36087 RepID=A0A077Z0X4_TRITR|nr:thioredoxin reductase 2 [Trichuris trichiura]
MACRLANAKSSYDLIVIGGGSGGLACAKEGTTLGSKWGLGGTCVNVGCIPKKLMHQAALLNQSLKDAEAFGWQFDLKSKIIDWQKLRGAVQNHIRSLNWGHRVQLNENVSHLPFSKVDYMNAYGTFIDSHTIQAVGDKKKEVVYGENIVIATGIRPKYPQIPGVEEGITSDDLFCLAHPPGKTLVVGGSCEYQKRWQVPRFSPFRLLPAFISINVALECSGFLSGLGFPVKTMIRSIPLRGFDQLTVEWTDEHGKVFSETFDTLLWAVGREPRLSSMSIDKAGLLCHPKSGKLIVDDWDKTNVENIYAIGDIQHFYLPYPGVHLNHCINGYKFQACPTVENLASSSPSLIVVKSFGRLELTPVAIRSGKLLARRLFGGSKELMDYDRVPTTVFTPVEYSCVGLPEEVAIQKFGESEVEVYHASFMPLEFSVPQRKSEKCYIKVICKRSSPSHVLGVHYCGPNAGEIMQGFAVAMRCNLTVDQLLGTVGIHPTCAEELVKLKVTKRSGKSASVTGC